MSENISIQFRDHRHGDAMCDVLVGSKSITLDVASARYAFDDLVWAALAILCKRYEWAFGMDEEPGGWIWLFRHSHPGELTLNIVHVDDLVPLDDETLTLRPIARDMFALAQDGQLLLKSVIDGETFANAVLKEVRRWRDDIGIVAFEDAFNVEFPVRLTAALEAALSTKPLQPLYERIDYSEFLPPDGSL